LLGRGVAAWYQHAGKTASGEIFRPDRLTAAHATLPLGTRVRVVNQRNHKSVVVDINDRMTTQRSIRRRFTIELSRGGAQVLGIDGIAPVAIYQIGAAERAEIAGAAPQTSE
jgi:rare lipoprotein A